MRNVADKRALNARLMLLASILAACCSPLTHAQIESSSSVNRTESKTPNDTDARKHYLIALEAIKNNDLPVALDELKQAAALAPNNALIRYNISVVESKEGKVKEALDDLRKAERLGLPANEQDDVDKLEAKLAYETKRTLKSVAAARVQVRRSELLEKLKQQLTEGGIEIECSSTADNFTDYEVYYKDVQVNSGGFDFSFTEVESSNKGGPSMLMTRVNQLSIGISASKLDLSKLLIEPHTYQDFCGAGQAPKSGGADRLMRVIIPTTAGINVNQSVFSQVSHNGRDLNPTKIEKSGTANEVSVIFRDQEQVSKYVTGLQELAKSEK